MPKRAREEEMGKPAAKKAKAESSSKKATFLKKAVASKYKNSEGKTDEVKFIDVGIALTPTTTGVVQLMNGSVPGTTATTRVGQKIQMTSIEVDLYYANSSTNLGGAGGVLGSNAVKIALVYDKQANGAAPTWANVFEAAVSANAPFTHREIDFLDRFDVLATFKGSIDQAGSLYYLDGRYVKVMLDVRYNTGTAGTVADIMSGSLYLVAACQTAADAASPTIVGRCRVRFHDM